MIFEYMDSSSRFFKGGSMVGQYLKIWCGSLFVIVGWVDVDHVGRGSIFSTHFHFLSEDCGTWFSSMGIVEPWLYQRDNLRSETHSSNTREASIALSLLKWSKTTRKENLWYFSTKVADILFHDMDRNYVNVTHNIGLCYNELYVMSLICKKWYIFYR